jgi:hypothetical protein
LLLALNCVLTILTLIKIDKISYFSSRRSRYLNHHKVPLPIALTGNRPYSEEFLEDNQKVQINVVCMKMSEIRKINQKKNKPKK